MKLRDAPRSELESRTRLWGEALERAFSSIAERTDAWRRRRPTLEALDETKDGRVTLAANRLEDLPYSRLDLREVRLATNAQTRERSLEIR
jgi:hypothetical protein